MWQPWLLGYISYPFPMNMQTVQSWFSYLFNQHTKCCLELIMGRCRCRCSASQFWGAPKFPLKSVGALKKKKKGCICTSGGCFQISLVWKRMLVLVSSCLQELNFLVVLLLVLFFLGGRDGSRGGTEAKLSSVTDSCFKWGTSQTPPACSTFVKMWSDLSKDVLNFHSLDMRIQLQIISSVHGGIDTVFNLNTGRNMYHM